MKAIISVIQAFLYMMTLALAYAYYAEVKFDVPDWWYTLLMFAIVGVSGLIAIGHVIGGGIMGLTAGGIWSGMRLGFTIGLGVALARLWPFCGIVAVVGFITQAPVWHWASALFCAIFFFVIRMFVNYIWSTFER